MAAANKQDSNNTGLRYAEEESYGTLPVTPIWYPLEPNSYDDFGGEVKTVARNPINASRQRKKGNIVDLDASGGFDSDITQTNMQDILQGFFFADVRTKATQLIDSITTQTGDDTIEIAETDGIIIGDLIFVTGAGTSGNNGLKRVTDVNVDTSLEVAETLVTEASPPADAQVVVVGHQFASADVNVTTSGNFATYTCTAGDFTDLNLVPGEWIYVGGDSSTLRFSTSANNGWKRVRSVSTLALVVDKSTSAMVNETGTGKTIQIFIGRVYKNESDPTLIVRRSYNLERTLGASDTALPTQIQSEYLVGAVPNELGLNIQKADKVTIDLSFVAKDHETRDGATGVKSGTRPTLVDADPINTSSDFSRIKLATVSSSSEAPTALFAFVNEITISLNNNISPNKAVGVLGAFDCTAGTFEVGGEINAYFADVAAVAAVRANSDVTLDIVVYKSNTGFVLDLPLLTLGNGRLDVQQDEPITLPLSMDAATAAKITSTMDYTLMMCFFDYVPTLADTVT